jgi:hypothetical protein
MQSGCAPELTRFLDEDNLFVQQRERLARLAVFLQGFAERNSDRGVKKGSLPLRDGRQGPGE